MHVYNTIDWVAKKKNRIIVKLTRAMMNEMHVPLFYWVEVVNTTIHVMNRTSAALTDGMTPFEKLWGIKPTIAYFKVFGCICYLYVLEEVKKKMDPRDVKCIFIGYVDEKKGYSCLNLQTKDMFTSRNVVFVEIESWHKSSATIIDDRDTMRVDMPTHNNVKHVS